MDKNVVNHYDIPAQLDLMQEECAELIKACGEVKRANGIGYITETDPQKTISNLIDSMAHVQNAILSTCYLLHLDQWFLDQEIEKSDKAFFSALKETGWDPGKKTEEKEKK